MRDEDKAVTPLAWCPSCGARHTTDSRPRVCRSCGHTWAAGTPPAPAPRSEADKLGRFVDRELAELGMGRDDLATWRPPLDRKTKGGGA